jgi:hypothetical protein
VIELLKEADMILNLCGRPTPPPGFRFVDLPRVIPFYANVSFPPQTPFQGRVANDANAVFLCRGIGISTTAPSGQGIGGMFAQQIEIDPYSIGDNYGISVAQNGSWMVVGFPGGEVAGVTTGSAGIYRLISGTWTLVQTLAPSDGESGGSFGTTVAISGNTLAVSAPNATVSGNASSGKLYIYILAGSSWVLQQEILSPTAGVDDAFGGSLALAGNTIFVSGSVGGAGNGGFYIYNRVGSTWSTTQHFLAGTAVGSHFGGAPHANQISLSPDATFAAAGNITASSDAGEVFVYQLSGGSWSLLQTITDPAATAFDKFGTGSVITDTQLLVGAPGGNAVYVFTRSATYGLTSTLLASPASVSSDLFGYALSLDPTTGILFIGAPGVASNRGSVYYFQASGTSFVQKQILIPVDLTAGDSFGGTVSAAGESSAIGGPNEPIGTGTGRVYVFSAGQFSNLRIRWPDGTYFAQNPSTPEGDDSFPLGLGANMIALDQEREIMPAGRISIEYSGTTTGVTKISFWGMLRYLLKVTDSGADASACLVGYPTAEQSKKNLAADAGKLLMMPDPVEQIAAMPRVGCSPNQNIMAPEFLLGNQAGAETPLDREDETFTFFSPAISVAPGQNLLGTAVIVPGADDVVIKSISPYITYVGPLSFAIPTIALRLPNGYSVMGGDQMPTNLLPGGGPMFPTLRVRPGDRLIVDVGNMNPNNSAGALVVVLQFDGVKRKLIQNGAAK